MTQKNETPVKSKVTTETKSVPVKPEKTPDIKPDLKPKPEAETDLKPELKSEPNTETNLKPEPEPEQTKKVNSAGVPGELLPEMVELVTELRDTVKRIDPRKHTAKTLRRSLSNVSDILADIEKLYPQG